jgi:flagellar basal-body rod modification protein FlgD
MTTTSSTGMTGLDSKLFDSLNAGSKPKTDKKANDQLDQADFLRLMTTQLKNQDPTKPLDGQQFMAQLAQFSTLNGIIEMKQSLDTLAQSLQSMNTLQASNLVGHSVLIDGDKGYLDADGSLSGRATLTETANNLTVVVSDAAGREVRRINLGAKPAGAVDFQWDGLDGNGARSAPGLYAFRVEGTVAGGKSVGFDTQFWARSIAFRSAKPGRKPP